MINKELNEKVQITMPKEDVKNLDTLVDAFNNNGRKTTRSEVLTHALREYLRLLLTIGKRHQAQKEINEKGEERND